jgi:hypothetical protein
MSEGVHAAVDSVQQPACDAVLDRALTEPETHQLRPSDHAMLALRERGDHRVAPRLQLPMYVRGNCSLDAHAPMVARRASQI